MSWPSRLTKVVRRPSTLMNTSSIRPAPRSRTWRSPLRTTVGASPPLGGRLGSLSWPSSSSCPPPPAARPRRALPGPPPHAARSTAARAEAAPPAGHHVKRVPCRARTAGVILPFTQPLLARPRPAMPLISWDRSSHRKGRSSVRIGLFFPASHPPGRPGQPGRAGQPRFITSPRPGRKRRCCAHRDPARGEHWPQRWLLHEQRLDPQQRRQVDDLPRRPPPRWTRAAMRWASPVERAAAPRAAARSRRSPRRARRSARRGGAARARSGGRRPGTPRRARASAQPS